MGVMNWELTVSLVVNIVAIAFFAGNLSANQKLMKETIGELKKGFDEKVKELKDSFDKKIAELKESFDKKIEENQEHTTENIKRLEVKQDKHNNIIERTYKLEGGFDKVCEQIKVANHRIEDLEKR